MDHFERVGPVLACVTEREAAQAFATLVHLERTHALSAISFSDGVRAIALRARRPFFCVSLSESSFRCGEGARCGDGG